jgi:CHAT domain-containing protein
MPITTLEGDNPFEQITLSIEPGQQSEAAAGEFERLLFDAVWQHDLERVRLLVEAARPWAAGQPFLQQWCAYALGYLALEADHEPVTAIRQFEALRASGPDLAPRLLERVLNRLGIAYEVNEQWDRALACYQECLELHRAKGSRLGQGVVLLNSAIVYHKAHIYDAAQEHCQLSIELLSENPDDKTWQTNLCASWNLLGLVYQDQGQLDKAQAAFHYALTLIQRWQDSNRQGPVCINLGNLYRSLGDHAQAESFYQTALEVLRQLDNRRQAAEVLYRLGALKLEALADFELSARLLEEALALAQATHNYEVIPQVYLSRAELYDRLGQPELALAQTQCAVETVESLRANIMLPDDRARMTASRVETYEQMVSRLCGQGTPSSYAKAFHYAEMSKSRTLIELLVGRPLRRPEHVPIEWLEKETELRQALSQLYERDNGSPEQIASLEVELGQLRERIRLQDAEFMSFQTVTPLTLDEVQTRLPKDSALLEYFTTGGDILVFVVTPHQVNVTHLPLRVKELQRAFKCVGENKFEPLRNLTCSTDNFLHTPWILHSLYQRLIEPLGQVVQSAQILCIVPHGLLHYVPFHALYAKTQDGLRYLPEQGREPRRIVYAPSATVLFDYCQRKPISGRAGCLALGYNGKLLTLAEEEALKVAQVTGGKSVVGSAATRALLLAEGANYRYVHLSCHGRFNATWPLSSCLTLADGTLDVTDVLRELRLNAELVCLSACETGRSHILRSDELIGLTRAFLYAGTPSLLVSQWVVDEFPTRLLMERFYRELENGSTKSEAISRAQHFIRTLTCDEVRQILLADGASIVQVNQQLQSHAALTGHGSIKNLRGDECLFAHPYYWAPFFLVGEQLAI